jgi:tetratricopeptide (TPR) repeat protein
VRIIAARSEKALAANRTPQTLHTFGVANLIMGEIDRAVPLLEQAVNQQSPDARMLNDLSSAYLARAARDKSQQDAAKALAAVGRALAIEPMLSEAVFNRALALERLGLVDEARTAWNEYLKIDDQSGWAEEAGSHLNAPR